MYPQLENYLQTKKPPTKKQEPFMDHLFKKIDEHIKNGGKILLLTLTKRNSEEITNYLLAKGYKAFYLHSEIATIDRWEIIKKLRTGQIDILVGINLLREGIDLPEVSLIAILDADKQWFLRGKTALIQNIGRAARNPNGEVILYGDVFTEAMTGALSETYRRRQIQQEYNLKNNITPSIAISNVKDIESTKTDEELSAAQLNQLTRGKVKRLKRMTKKEKEMIMTDLRKQLETAIQSWEFEQAATIRDQIKELEEGTI